MTGLEHLQLKYPPEVASYIAASFAQALVTSVSTLRRLWVKTNKEPASGARLCDILRAAPNYHQSFISIWFDDLFREYS
jgi:hypothetical protein